MEVFSGGEDCRLPYGGSLLLKLGALDASLLSPPSPPWLPLQPSRNVAVLFWGLWRVKK